MGKKRFTPEEQRAKRNARLHEYYESHKEKRNYQLRYRELSEVFEKYGYVIREPKEPELIYDEMKEVFRKYGYVVS